MTSFMGLRRQRRTGFETVGKEAEGRRAGRQPLAGIRMLFDWLVTGP